MAHAGLAPRASVLDIGRRMRSLAALYFLVAPGQFL